MYAAAEPRFPFGHGLTYTTFGYGGLRLEPAAEGAVTVTFDLTNTGDRDGTEVVQLYASYPGPGQPRRRLCGFARVPLAAGETRAVGIEVPLARLALWDVATGRMAVPPGPIEIGAGASSGDIRQSATLSVPGDRPARGEMIRAADFDDYENITLVDRTREDGIAVTPASPGRPGWLTFRSVAARRSAAAVFCCSCATADGGRIEAWPARPGGGHPPDGTGVPLASVRVPGTGGRYEWAEASVPLTLPDATMDLCVAIHGPVRLDWLRLDQ
jgi:beta-glucosidase